jgi:hypothetical protein
MNPTCSMERAMTNGIYKAYLPTFLPTLHIHPNIKYQKSGATMLCDCFFSAENQKLSAPSARCVSLAALALTASLQNGRFQAHVFAAVSSITVSRILPFDGVYNPLSSVLLPSTQTSPSILKSYDQRPMWTRLLLSHQNTTHHYDDVFEKERRACLCSGQVSFLEISTIISHVVGNNRC